MESECVIVKKYNEELVRVREMRVLSIIEDIKKWNAEDESIGKLILMVESASNVVWKMPQHKYYSECYHALEGLKSAVKYEDKVDMIKKYMRKMWIDDLIICDKNGFCICSLNYMHALDMYKENKFITAEHIDDIVDEYSQKDVWKEEHKVYKESTNACMGVLTSDDMLYATKKGDKSILSEEYIEAKNIQEAHARGFMEKYSSKLKH